MGIRGGGVVARMGRPTNFNAGTLATTKDYIENYKSKYGHQMPSVAGLAVVLKVGRRGIYQWEDQQESPEFQHMLEELQAEQELVLFNRGLVGEFNSTISKLALTKHGYSDKQEQEITGTVSIDSVTRTIVKS